MGDERGVALILALLTMLLLTALGMALAMTTTTERRISTNYRDGVETIYAADAAVERVMQDVLTVPDWNRILDNVVIRGRRARPSHAARRVEAEPAGSHGDGSLRQDRLLRRRHSGSDR